MRDFIGSFVYSTSDLCLGMVSRAIEGECADDIQVLGLGPVAVQPDYCRQGIGSRLIGHSLNVR